MSTEIVMPRLSDTMDRGTVAHWNKQIGDQVKRGEVILEIETDKANMELESYSDGILATIMVSEGESAPVGSPIGIVAKDEAEFKDLGTQSTVATSRDEHPAPSAISSHAESKQSTVMSEEVLSNGAGRRKASPLARRIAHQRGIDLAHVTGTGPSGRIVREDVESFVNSAPATLSAATGESTTSPDAEALPIAGPQPAAVVPGAGDEEVALTRMQLTVGRRLSESMSTAPHFYVTSEIDMTHAVRMRKQINEAEPDLKVSFNDLVVKAVGVVLRKFPGVNASLHESKVRRHSRVNVGIAVDLPGGLIVPVLKDVDGKGLREIATEVRSLVGAAREARLKPDHFEGGTFTVSNLGMFGVNQFTAIINPPESAILAVGAIQDKPVAIDGEIVIRSRMRVTLSCDHRVIYGADAAAFLAELRRTLEHPVLALL